MSDLSPYTVEQSLNDYLTSCLLSSVDLFKISQLSVYLPRHLLFWRWYTWRFNVRAITSQAKVYGLAR